MKHEQWKEITHVWTADPCLLEQIFLKKLGPSVNVQAYYTYMVHPYNKSHIQC